LLLGSLAVTWPDTAAAGQFSLAPGATTTIDTGERGNYTTVTIRNAGAEAGRLRFAGSGRVVDVPAGGKADIYEAFGRAGTSVSNTGPVPLIVQTRYMETFHGP
jgi:hypothetical protein